MIKKPILNKRVKWLLLIVTLTFCCQCVHSQNISVFYKSYDFFTYKYFPWEYVKGAKSITCKWDTGRFESNYYTFIYTYDKVRQIQSYKEYLGDSLLEITQFSYNSNNQIISVYSKKSSLLNKYLPVKSSSDNDYVRKINLPDSLFYHFVLKMSYGKDYVVTDTYIDSFGYWLQTRTDTAFKSKDLYSVFFKQDTGLHNFKIDTFRSSEGTCYLYLNPLSNSLIYTKEIVKTPYLGANMYLIKYAYFDTSYIPDSTKAISFYPNFSKEEYYRDNKKIREIETWYEGGINKYIRFFDDKENLEKEKQYAHDVLYNTYKYSYDFW